MAKSKSKKKNKNKNKKQEAHDVKNRVLALMTDPMFKMQVVKSKKGKGSYNRKNKSKKMEYDLKVFLSRIFK